MSEKKPDDYHTPRELRGRALDLLQLHEHQNAPPDDDGTWAERHARPALDALLEGDNAMRDARQAYERASKWLEDQMKDEG